jgi:hypothetical protein
MKIERVGFGDDIVEKMKSGNIKTCRDILLKSPESLTVMLDVGLSKANDIIQRAAECIVPASKTAHCIMTESFEGAAKNPERLCGDLWCALFFHLQMCVATTKVACPLSFEFHFFHNSGPCIMYVSFLPLAARKTDHPTKDGASLHCCLSSTSS